MYIMHAELPHVAAWQRRHSKSFHQSIERTLSLHGACSFMKYCMLRRVCESAVHMCDTFCDVWLLVLGWCTENKPKMFVHVVLSACEFMNCCLMEAYADDVFASPWVFSQLCGCVLVLLLLFLFCVGWCRKLEIPSRIDLVPLQMCVPKSHDSCFLFPPKRVPTTCELMFTGSRFWSDVVCRLAVVYYWRLLSACM